MPPLTSGRNDAKGFGAGPVGTRGMTDAFLRAALPVVRVPRNTLQDHVYRQLCELILNGEIAPGQLVTIQALADAFGVSAMPVREALQRLTAARVLTVISGRSIGVPPLSYERLSDLRRVRIEVELLAAVWANAKHRQRRDRATAGVRDGDGSRRSGPATTNNTCAGTVRFTSGFTRLRNPRRCSRSSRRYGCRSVLISTSSTHPAITSRRTSSTSSCLPRFARAMERRSVSHCATTSTQPIACWRPSSAPKSLSERAPEQQTRISSDQGVRRTRPM